INLFISIIKKSNFELAIEKAVELGVSSITPVKANRSQYDILNKERLQKIIKEATEQSGRVTLPEIRDTLTTKEVISENPEIIIFDMEGESIKNAPKADSILIGPEGGWSDEERKMFDKTYSVSKNTLRAETAVIAGLVSIMLV
ncbi:MAG: RsmE family RNA methyltransferase, partial [Candidatus Pacebacteria bacterium]|nr:RsmE family RNA methyltransferase [Candidatus Paceibacterota bacterium]